VSIGLRVWLAIGISIAALAAAPAGPADAREGNRTIKLYFGHTGERGEFTFKKNGRYDRSELDKINRLLRDWRRDEPAKMDPQLLDLVWSIYKQTGSREYIHVVSAYRSPTTNDMLRKRSSGVAKNSQHTLGKAMDFYIPGVNLDKLRAIAMKAQGGGVGYYPRSGSPFVHVDTGNVRAWPRMTRQQLLALFPNGETLHLPADGKPLEGYERALAQRQTSGATAVAYLDNGSDEESRRGKATVGGWLKRVFDADEAEDSAEATAVAATAVAAPPAIPAAPAAEAASGEPTVLVAIEEPAADPRLPKARPGESLLALAAAPGDALAVSPDQDAISPDQNVTSLAFAPPPRSRPDSALLLASLGNADNGTAALSVDADAIAALAQLNDGVAAQAGVAAEEVTAETRMAAALGQDDVDAVLPSAADSAILAGFAALEEDPQPVPSALTALAAAAALGEAKAASETARARPVALAFSGTDLVPAAAATSDHAVGAAPAAEQDVIVALNLPAPQPESEATYQGDAAALIEMIATPAMHDRAYVRLAMPRPASADLFNPPDGTAAAASPMGGVELPTDRFETSLRDDGPARESFFSRLFVSLVQ
jgi:uncharacterized protein YcbK (DUF882 family)